MNLPDLLGLNLYLVRVHVSVGVVDLPELSG